MYIPHASTTNSPNIIYSNSEISAHYMTVCVCDQHIITMYVTRQSLELAVAKATSKQSTWHNRRHQPALKTCAQLQVWSSKWHRARQNKPFIPQKLREKWKMVLRRWRDVKGYWGAAIVDGSLLNINYWQFWAKTKSQESKGFVWMPYRVKPWWPWHATDCYRTKWREMHKQMPQACGVVGQE